jgi:hypothetical protein
MKKLIYLLSITIALTVFTSVNASAKTLAPFNNNTATVAPGVMCDLVGDILGLLGGGSNSGSNSGSNCPPANGNGGSTALPINGSVEFLMIAGAIIGIATVQRYKIAKNTAVQE